VRASVDPADKGYKKDHYNYEVYLDGILLPNCITADEEEGWALVYGEAMPAGFHKEEVFGKIEINLIDRREESES